MPVHDHYRRASIGGVTIGLIAGIACTPTAAVAAAAGVDFDIHPGSLDAALLTYAAQAHRQLILNADLVRGLTSQGLKGRFAEDDALVRLLAGSGIVFDHQRADVLVLKRSTRAAPAASDPADPIPALGGGTGPAAPGPGPSNSPITQVEDVVVTGTNIRRVAAIDPVTIVDRDAMDRAGQPTVADMLLALPQNFGGVSTPASAVVGSDRIGNNDTAASGVNLRGLGATATLVLVNGRRMAGSGLQGDFADVSAIPTAAVDHVEVLLDGASALYGSDAVGGVVNVILRHDFDGAETRVRDGFTSDGGAAETQIGQTFGKTWSTGNALVSFEYEDRDALRSDQRPYTATADLRPFGGTDQRIIYSHPGNILTVDPTTGDVVPAYAIPTGQNGVGLTPASFLPGQTNLSNPREDTDVLPQQTRYSLYADVNQALGERVTVNADFRYSDRSFAYNVPGSLDIFDVTGANPFFVSPNGTTDELIGYSFTDELGAVHVTGSSENFAGSAGVTADLGHSWQAEAYAAFAEELDHRDNDHHLDTAFLNEALGAAPDDPLTSFSTAKDGFFNPFGGETGVNSKAVLDFINSGYLHTIDRSEVLTGDFKVDGTLFTALGGDWKLAFGGQVRQESFEDKSVALASEDVPTTAIAGPFQRTVTAAFGELRAPLVGPANALPGVERLELSLAGRIENYAGLGTTANPKVGLLWAPFHDLKLRATYGTSFRAPSLSEVNELQDIGPTFLPEGAAQKLVLLLTGGNTALRPETATSWTAGFDYTPRQIPGFTLSATWFDTHFTHQIGIPVSDDIFNVLGNPTYAPFVTPIDPNNPADVAKVSALLAKSTDPNASLFPANAYNAIVDARFVNTGGLLVRGVDLSVGYGFRIGAERIDLAGTAAILTDYQQQVTPNSPPVQLLDQAGEPVDFKARGQATWTHGPVALTFAVNYIDSYRDPVSGHPISSWTTADLQLLWKPVTTGPLARTTVAINIQNLADAAPPFFDAPQGVGYDPANADPLGRVVSLQLTKRW